MRRSPVEATCAPGGSVAVGVAVGEVGVGVTVGGTGVSVAVGPGGVGVAVGSGGRDGVCVGCGRRLKASTG